MNLDKGIRRRWDYYGEGWGLSKRPLMGNWFWLAVTVVCDLLYGRQSSSNPGET